MEETQRISSPIAFNGAFFILIALFWNLDLAAQSEFKTNMLLGISTSQISGDELAGFDKVGIHAGIGVRMDVATKWQLAMDISYIQKGSRKNARPDKGDYVSYLMRLNYAEVPIYVVFEQDKWKLEAGLTAAYLLKAAEEDQNGPIQRLGREYKTMDVGAMLGLYYPVRPKFDLNVRLSNSLLPVREHAGGAIIRLNQGQYNSVLSFGFRYYLKSNKDT